MLKLPVAAAAVSGGCQQCELGLAAGAGHLLLPRLGLHPLAGPSLAARPLYLTDWTDCCVHLQGYTSFLWRPELTEHVQSLTPGMISKH